MAEDQPAESPGTFPPGPADDSEVHGGASGGPEPLPAKRPFLERLGMAAIAVVLAALFVVVAVAGYAGGELFIAGMGAIGALMTLWVGGLTLLRG